MDPKENLILIGMPGAGKSTVGVLLAKMTGRNFVDTDLCIQAGTGQSLQEIIAEQGLAGFRQVEEDYLMCLDMRGGVVATGGSVVYSEAGMGHLAATGPVIFLDVPLAELTARMTDHNTRGMVIEPGMTLADLHGERLPLYRRWAGVTIDCGGLDQQQTAEAVLDALDSHRAE
jgi:shikimate kinase